MARDQNTVAKRLRETDRKRKAQDKRARREKRKNEAGNPVTPLSEDSQSSSSEDNVSDAPGGPTNS